VSHLYIKREYVINPWLIYPVYGHNIKRWPTIELIKQSPFDNEFRKEVAKHIQNAKKSIKIVTGEISAYNYFDLRDAAEDAAKRGVKIDVYANDPDNNIINRLISHEINVYIGKEDLSEHFMICDDKDVIVSQKDEHRIRPTPMGNRKGIIIDIPNKVEGYIERFEKLKSNAEKKRIEGTDTLVKALRNPIR
jgi:hypothetical protein